MAWGQAPRDHEGLQPGWGPVGADSPGMGMLTQLPTEPTPSISLCGPWHTPPVPTPCTPAGTSPLTTAHACV